MIILHGEYNIAKVMLPNDREEGFIEIVPGVKQARMIYKYLDYKTQEQIQTFLNHPAFKGDPIVIMPDTHYGKGSCVGFTFKLNDYVIPNIVGVDIGCGIMSTKLGIKYSDNMDLDVLDEWIRDHIPAGFSIHNNDNNGNEYPVFWEQVKEICLSENQDYSKVRRSIGTLGGGNHFIELGVDEDEYLWLTIHSGSRNFGLQVASYYQKKADSNCAKYFQDFGDLNFLIGFDLEMYIHDLGIAQEYAKLNRLKMMTSILNWWNDVDILERIDSVHNYIDMEDNIIRKGATPAREGQKVVIPFNMQDGLIIGTGKGNPEWNYSAPHGAGRILSRKKAKEQLNLEDAIVQMKWANVFTTSLNKDTLDEAPGAYKDKQLILDMIKDTVEVTNFVKPIYNFKAG